MSIIIPANTLAAGGFEVANSCRFDGSSSYMQKTLGTPTSAKKATFSLWFKTSDTKASNGGRCLMSWGNDYGAIYVNETNDGQWEINLDNSDTVYKGTAGGQLSKDPAAWSHLCLIIDTTNSTANDRFQFFLNNVRVVFSANNNNNPDENYDVPGLADGQVIAVGRRHRSTNLYYSGYMAQVCFIDGNNLAATQFGEVDEDSGIFKPIDVSGLTFGNNGFYLDFEASGNLGNDANGGTDLTESGLAAIDQSTDTCTNNFATMNPLDNFYYNGVFSEGNLKIINGSGREAGATSTIALSSGKWFWEAKPKSNVAPVIGIQPAPSAANTSSSPSMQVNGFGYLKTGKVETSNGSGGSTVLASYATYAADDIIGVALDLDSSQAKIYFYKNGALQGSGVNITSASATTNGHYFVGFGVLGGQDTFEVNFGSPPYSESGGNSDANDFGNFSMSVPSGFFSICTKNLAEYG